MLIGLADNVRVAQQEQDVLEGGIERGSKNPLHVLNDDGARSQNPRRFRNCGKHVPAIGKATVLPTKGEWLTWWSTREQVDFTTDLGEVVLANVALVQHPAGDGIDAARLIFPDRGAAIPVPFNDDLMGKAGLRRAERETASSSE
jgi:hypothetical protein